MVKYYEIGLDWLGKTELSSSSIFEGDWESETSLFTLGIINEGIDVRLPTILY